MRIAFLVFNLDGMGGTSRSAITQANALAPDHAVTLVSITRSAERPHYEIDDRITVRYLVDVRDTAAPATVEEGLATVKQAARLHQLESALVPARWDGQFTGLCDVALESALPRLDVDVVVSVTPSLLACAVQLTPPATVVVHQEHRASSDRTSGREPLLAFAPQADVVAVLTGSLADWLHDELGELAPEIVVMPNPLPIGFAPRSRLDVPLIVAAGRLVPEKQFGKLVQAFGEIAGEIPSWRLRIWGEGPQRQELLRQVRKYDLWDRVELPGSTPDMRGEWAKASVSALTSRAEGLPLVVQEAMAAGVPVASFDCASGPRELIQHEVNGLLVSPESMVGMAGALLRLTTDDELRHRLGTAAAHSARAYDARALAERWVGVYADARARRAGRGPLRARAAAALTRRPRPAPGPPALVGDAPADAGVTPAAARQAALRLAAGCAEQASDWWIAVPPHETTTAVLVLPITARDRFLAALADADVPAYLSLRDPGTHGWPERRGPVTALAGELRRGMTPVVCLEPWPEIDGRATLIGSGGTVEVEFWTESVTGALVAPRRHRYAAEIPVGATRVETTVEGLSVPTLPLLARPTVTECRFPVDIVYTWVDGADPAWNQARERRLAEVAGTALTREASGRARFLSRDELKYSMRSVHLFAPWVRRIHLVTAGQVPEWLDTDHPDVTVVDHREILPAGALPTFNSHAIESALHRVPDLSEHFVYLNDDVFLARPTRPEAFFSPAGLFASFFSPTTVGLDDQPEAAPFVKAAWNNRRLLEEAFGVVTTHHLAHTPHPHRVSVLTEIDERFADAITATAHAPFRSETDVSLLSSLAQHYGLLTGTSYVGEADLAFVNLANSDVDWQLAQLLDRTRSFVCLGDHHDHALRRSVLDAMLAEWFEAYFPVPAPWERDA